jgi:photosystem II stability/assembly factor-like uncharacterized protein
MPQQPRLPLLLALAALTLATTPLVADPVPWEPVGPAGGDVRELTVDPRHPQRVYLGTVDGGFYVSEDDGASWTRPTPGFVRRGCSLDDILVGTDGEILVGYWEVEGGGGGIARSTDGGRTFVDLPGMVGRSVRGLARASSLPQTLVATTLKGVFRSDDDGTSWRRISPETHAGLVNAGSVAIDPEDADTIYVGTWHLAWKTTDGGKTWINIRQGMITDSDVMTLTIDRRDRRAVWGTACSGIYRSRSAGQSWAKLPGIPYSSRRTRAFAQHPLDPTVFLAGTTEGLYITRDDAASWQHATSTDLVVNAVSILRDGTFLIGTDAAGVLRSTDGGRTWTGANQGLFESSVSRVAVDLSDGRVFAGLMGSRQHGGVRTAGHLPGSWAPTGSGLEGRNVLSISASSALLVGTDAGLFRHDAQTWARVPTVVDGIEERPQVYDVKKLTPQVWLLATSRGLLRTEDGGASWKRVRLGLSSRCGAVATSPGTSGRVYAATPLGVFVSQDSGSTWTATGPSAPTGWVNKMMILPGSQEVILVVTTDGLFRSVDDGRSWQWRGGGLPHGNVPALAMTPDGARLYACNFTYGGLYESRDRGENWSAVDTEGLHSARLWTLAVVAGKELLAAAPLGGLYRMRLADPAAHLAQSMP